jgi:cytochrome c peroxidase
MRYKWFVIFLSIILLVLFAFKERILSSNEVLDGFAPIDSAKSISPLLTIMRLPQENASIVPDAAQKKMITFGRKLFFDPGFSKNGAISCASCHIPGLSFTDAKPTSMGVGLTAMNAPTIVNAHASLWFFHNGRADSLAMQALGPTENPLEHGFSRVDVAKRIYETYKEEYEELFGSLIKTNAPSSTPSTKPTLPSSEVAAFALSTLGSHDFLKKILSEAQSQGRQPVDILKQTISGTQSAPTDFDKLYPEHQEAINRIFANFGLAIEAYEKTIRTKDTAFDLFVDRLQQSSTDQEALNESFGEQELAGLKLFFGRGGCHTCHNGPYFTDHQFHNIGLPATSKNNVDLGRSYGLLLVKDSPFNCKGPYLTRKEPSESCAELDYLETHASELVGAFKTPTLRNVSQTAPYGHDGRFKNLQEILDHYNEPEKVKPAVGHREGTVRNLHLSASELQNLEVFMKALNSDVVEGVK